MGMEELTFEAYKRSYWDYFLVPEKRFAAASRPLRQHLRHDRLW